MPPSAGRSKVVKQRRYRKREGEYFNTLRDVIKELTGDEPQKRQEILMKAIDIIDLQLRAESEIRKQREAQDSCEVHHLTEAAHLGYFTQSFYEPRRRQSNAELNAPSTSSTQFHPYSQEHHTASGMYFALDQVMYQEYDRNSPHYPNFIP